MATTSRKVTELALGMRDTAGAVVASGKARFYQPGTLVEQTVYSDDACTAPITQPVTLNAGGQGTVYALEPVRMLVKDSTETTTYYDSIVNLNRHDSVYVTHPSFNSGGETTLKAVLTTLGTGTAYQPTGTATARTFSDVLTEAFVSVKTFGATGDGSTDDTAAIQATVDYVESLGGGWVYIPKGTFKITGTVTIDAVGVKIRGAGPGVAILKNFSTTGNAVTITTGAVTCKVELRNFSITANTTSSGKGVEVTTGLGAVFDDVRVALHRGGFDTSVSSAARAVYTSCYVESTDNNASCIGFSVGYAGRISDSCSFGSGTNGSGIVLGDGSACDRCQINSFATAVLASGSSAKVRDAYITAPTTGVSLSGASSLASGVVIASGGSPTTGISITGTGGASVNNCTVVTGTTGISLGVAGARAVGNTVSGCTTGIAVGNFANCAVTLNNCSGNTTDIDINTSVTGLIEHSNVYTTLSGGYSGQTRFSNRLPVAAVGRTTESATTTTFTPSPAIGMNVYVNTSASAVALTVNPTSTTGLVDGSLMWIFLVKNGANDITLTWDAQYVKNASYTLAAANSATMGLFRWRAATSKWIQFNYAFGMDPTVW